MGTNKARPQFWRSCWYNFAAEKGGKNKNKNETKNRNEQKDEDAT